MTLTQEIRAPFQGILVITKFFGPSGFSSYPEYMESSNDPLLHQLTQLGPPLNSLLSKFDDHDSPIQRLKMAKMVPRVQIRNSRLSLPTRNFHS